MEPCFKRFGPKEVIEWFGDKGVSIKKEADGRMFPSSNNSQTIIDCFESERKKYGIALLTSTKLTSISLVQNQWEISANDTTIIAKKLLIATGSDKHIWELLELLSLEIVPPVPSLFTFQLADEQLKALAGVALEHTKVTYGILTTSGPTLITHWGVSGPAILKMSAFAARQFAQKNYHFKVFIDWCQEWSKEDIAAWVKEKQETAPKKRVRNDIPALIPKRFWEYLCTKSNVSEFQNWSETGKKHIKNLTENIKNMPLEANGKTTFKEEFVTAGGIDLKEISQTTFEVQKIPNLYLAGEVLNIDAITGGFNFQAAWTGGWHVGQSVAGL